MHSYALPKLCFGMQRMRYQNFVLVWVTHKYQLTKLHTKLRFVSQLQKLLDAQLRCTSYSVAVQQNEVLVFCIEVEQFALQIVRCLLRYNLQSKLYKFLPIA